MFKKPSHEGFFMAFDLIVLYFGMIKNIVIKMYTLFTNGPSY
jgi:hypothetical protein